MKIILVTVTIVTSLWSSTVSAYTISAICKEITGKRLDVVNGRIDMTNDKFIDVIWSYSGASNNISGTLIAQNSKGAGGKTTSEKVLVTRHSSGQWSFISLLEDAVWVHTIYPSSGKIMVSINTAGSDNDLAGKFMTGQCRVDEKF